MLYRSPNIVSVVGVAEFRRLVYKLLENNWKTEEGYDRITLNRFSRSGHKNVKCQNIQVWTWSLQQPCLKTNPVKVRIKLNGEWMYKQKQDSQ
jgi:hypothetical protein